MSVMMGRQKAGIFTKRASHSCCWPACLRAKTPPTLDRWLANPKHQTKIRDSLQTALDIHALHEELSRYISLSPLHTDDDTFTFMNDVVYKIGHKVQTTSWSDASQVTISLNKSTHKIILNGWIHGEVNETREDAYEAELGKRLNAYPSSFVEGSMVGQHGFKKHGATLRPNSVLNDTAFTRWRRHKTSTSPSTSSKTVDIFTQSTGKLAYKTAQDVKRNVKHSLGRSVPYGFVVEVATLSHTKHVEENLYNISFKSAEMTIRLLKHLQDSEATEHDVEVGLVHRDQMGHLLRHPELLYRVLRAGNAIEDLSKKGDVITLDTIAKHTTLD